MRKFNREGPVFADRHYCIPPLNRVNLDEIRELIADTKYFVSAINSRISSRLTRLSGGMQ